MSRQTLKAGTPILLALVIVSAVSLTARYYHDHNLAPAVQQTQVVSQNTK
ncbi:MAG TPA: hypothetical protein VHA78_01940 [Candidatus Peribacteraceae bacterium]|nr:hypothetical protein [Candidatus Peribacteraceae bacterium]